MEITNKTKLKDLLSEYPWLKEEIVSINDKFKLLHTPNILGCFLGVSAGSCSLSLPFLPKNDE